METQIRRATGEAGLELTAAAVHLLRQGSWSAPSRLTELCSDLELLTEPLGARWRNLGG